MNKQLFYEPYVLCENAVVLINIIKIKFHNGIKKREVSL